MIVTIVKNPTPAVIEAYLGITSGYVQRISMNAVTGNLEVAIDDRATLEEQMAIRRYLGDSTAANILPIADIISLATDAARDVALGTVNGIVGIDDGPGGPYLIARVGNAWKKTALV